MNVRKILFIALLLLPLFVPSCTKEGPRANGEPFYSLYYELEGSEFFYEEKRHFDTGERNSIIYGPKYRYEPPQFGRYVTDSSSYVCFELSFSDLYLFIRKDSISSYKAGVKYHVNFRDFRMQNPYPAGNVSFETKGLNAFDITYWFDIIEEGNKSYSFSFECMASPNNIYDTLYIKNGKLIVYENITDYKKTYPPQNYFIANLKCDYRPYIQNP